MKKFRYGLGAGAVIALVFIWIWTSGPTPTGFVVGPPLPPGKVTPQLVSTWDTAVLLAPDGSLWAWGGNDFGLEAFYLYPTIAERPRRIGLGTDWHKVAANWIFALALKDDGSLWGIGNSLAVGQTARYRPSIGLRSFKQIGKDTNWVEISVGAGHCLALKNDGSLWGWGQSECGQVGDGTTNYMLTPTLLSTSRDWKAISAGAFNSYAIKRDGTIWGWGLDGITGGANHTLVPSQIDPGSNWISISANDFSVDALKSEGTLWIRGQNAGVSASAFVKGSSVAFTQIGREKSWREAHAGWRFFLARKQDGTWWGSGENEYGQLGMNRFSQPFSEPRCLPFRFEPWAFAVGQGNTLLLARDGTLWSWGQRLGSDEKPAFVKVKQLLNRVTDFLPGHFRKFKIDGPRSDSIPHLLWKLPHAPGRSIETDSHTANQINVAATNGTRP